MANAFGSFGGGFSQGFATGRHIRANKQAVKANQQAERTAQFKETLDAARTQSLDTFTQFSDLARQAAERGATEEQLQNFRQGAQAALAVYAQTLEQIRAQATTLGEDASIVPSGGDFVNQHIALFDAAVQAGSMMTPGAVGERDADQQLAEAKRIAETLDVPVERVAQAMGIVPTPEGAKRIGPRMISGIGPGEAYEDDQGPFYLTKNAQGGFDKNYVSSAELTTLPTQTETGPPGSFDPRTRAQQGEAVVMFQQAVEGAAGATEMATELLNIAKQSPESLGAPGTILRIGNEMIRTVSSLSQFMYGEEPQSEKDVDSFTYEGFSGDLRNAAIESQAFRAGVFGIAFAAAVVEQGSRPTDKDIQAYIDQIAGSTADPKAFARVVRQFIGRIDSRVRRMARVRGIPEEEQSRAFAEMDRTLEGFNAFFAEETTTEEAPDELEGFGDLSEEEQEELRRLMRGQNR